MAFRISLACLQKAEFMILDEVDSSASENISAMLFERAIRFAPSVKQWFIVTHKPETIAMLQREFETTVFEMSKGALIE
jgi:DNA repair ATPase RecN